MLATEPGSTQLATGLLIRRQDQQQVAGLRAPPGSTELQTRRELSGHLPLHVEGASPPDPAVDEIATPGIAAPLLGVSLDRVEVAEQGDRRAVRLPAQARHQVWALGLGGQ